MDEVDALEQENLELQDAVDELMASNEDIVTFEKGKYVTGSGKTLRPVQKSIIRYEHV